VVVAVSAFIVVTVVDEEAEGGARRGGFPSPEAISNPDHPIRERRCGPEAYVNNPQR
jgi:hypothetical protein